MASRKALPRLSIAFALSFLAVAGSSQTLPPAHSLDGDAAVITILIRPDRTKEFEEVLSYVLRSTKAAGWQAFRSQERVHQIQQIFQRYREAFVGQSVLRLSRVNLP